jgi:hypothetical protein
MLALGLGPAVDRWSRSRKRRNKQPEGLLGASASQGRPDVQSFQGCEAVGSYSYLHAMVKSFMMPIDFKLESDPHRYAD